MISTKLFLLLFTTTVLINAFYVGFEHGKVYNFYIKFYDFTLLYENDKVLSSQSFNGSLTVEKINDWLIFQFKNLTVKGFPHKDEFENRFRVKLINNEPGYLESMTEEFQKTKAVKERFIVGMFSKYNDLVELPNTEIDDKVMELEVQMGLCNATVKKTEKNDKWHIIASISLDNCTIADSVWDVLERANADMSSDTGRYTVTIYLDKATHKMVLLRTYMRLNLIRKDNGVNYSAVHKQTIEYLGEADALKKRI